MNKQNSKKENKPTHLYHYTTIDTLALILRDKKIKFSPLTILDDIEEECVKNAQIYGKYVFVSSWTEENNESIPMWNMYAGLNAGVRIKMPLMPFKEYSALSDVVVNAVPQKLMDFYKERNAAIEEYLDDLGGTYFIIKSMPYLYKINYVKDLKTTVDDKYKCLIDPSAEEKLLKLGRYKKVYWDFQKEWRYVMILMPIKYDEQTAEPVSMINNLFFYFPFKNYFLPLNKMAFSEMEVTLSPNISDGNRAIVEVLKEKYNPRMKVLDSKLKGNLRE